MALKNYKKPDVKNIKPGYLHTAYLSAVSNFTILAKPAALAVDENKYIIVDDHTFPLTKGFAEIYLKRDKNTTGAESKGEAGASWLIYTGKIFIPGDGPVVQNLINEILNEDLIILMPDIDCDENTVVQLGCICNPSSLTAAKFDGGTADGDVGKGWEIDFKTTCRDFYQGTITVQA